MTASVALQPTPYKDAALAYRERGWVGVLPVPARSKRLEVVGWTGRDGGDPSGADVYEWREMQPSANIALRMPPDVIGLDIDGYKEIGAATFAAALARYGTLPPTWRSTARDDGLSGILYFRVPPGLIWAGQLDGGGCEIIQRSHRYAVAPPSIHPSGWTYRWYDPASAVTITIPSPQGFPLLPETWIAGLSRGQQGEVAKLDMDSGEAWEWVAALPGSGEVACALMRGESARAIVALNSGKSRHDELLPRVLKLLRLATEGHRGIALELEALRLAFISAVTARGEGQRTSAQARSEWQRALDGGAGQIRANTPELIWRDPCRPPFSAELLAEGARRRAVALLGHPSGTDDPTHETDDLGERLNSWGGLPGWVEATEGRTVSAGPLELKRTDGAPLWYPGRINGLIGPSESGKSWIALLAVYQAVTTNTPVVILDFEDSMEGIAERLRSLGLLPADLQRLVTYISPDEPLTDESVIALRSVLGRVKPGLIVVDGVNAAMTLMGLDLLNNKDVTEFYQRLMRLLVETGATVAYVDHTPKNDTEMLSKGGIGAQAKRAMTTGCALRVEVVSTFDRAHKGLLRLTVDKDRAGHVRRIASGDNKIVAMAHMKPGVYGSITIALEPPDSETGSPVVDDVMLRVADFLEVHGVSSKTQIELNVRGNVPDIRRAARDLVQQGFVATEPGPRNALLHRLVRTPRPTPSHPVHVQPAHHVPLSIDRDVLGDRSFQLPMVEVELPDPADDPSAEG